MRNFLLTFALLLCVGGTTYAQRVSIDGQLWAKIGGQGEVYNETGQVGAMRTDGSVYRGSQALGTTRSTGEFAAPGGVTVRIVDKKIVNAAGTVLATIENGNTLVLADGRRVVVEETQNVDNVRFLQLWALITQ